MLVGHEVHPGNAAEVGSPMPMIRSLLERWPMKRILLAADEGQSLNSFKELGALQAEVDAAGARSSSSTCWPRYRSVATSNSCLKFVSIATGGEPERVAPGGAHRRA